MAPKKLTLKGFKGVRSGFGREEIALDLDALAADAAQVAIIGPNGAGKSTILDNLQPYRLMPSRAGKNSPEGFSYWDHVLAPQALKELDWEHGGARYRSILVFKSSGKTRKAEAYLHVLQDGRYQPARLPDGTVSDGKSESYDRLVEGILGKPETFFTSVFAAQNRKLLSAYTDGEVKTLLADLLGLAKLREIGARALEVAKLLGAGLEAVRGSLTKLSAAEQRLPALKTEAERLEAQSAAQSVERRSAQKAHGQAQTALATAKAARAAAAETEKRREELSRRLALLRKTSAERRAQCEADYRRESERYVAAEAESQRQDCEADTRIAALKELALRRRALLSRKEEILASSEAAARLAIEEKTLATRHAELRKLEAQANALRAERSRLAGGLQGALERHNAQAALCDDLKKRSRLTTEVPCNGTELQPRCPLLAEALVAKASLAAKEEDLGTLKGRQAALGRQIEELGATITGLADAGNAVARTEAELEGIRTRLREQQSFAALAAQLADAEEAIGTFEKQIVELQAGIDERAKKRFELSDEHVKTLANLNERLAAIDEELRRAEEQIAADLAKLPAPFDEARLTAAEQALSRTEKDLAGLELRSEETKAVLAGLKARVEATDAEIAEGRIAKENAARLEGEIAKWTLLGRAFSTNGIVALSIDDAGPELAGLVNDLLLACFGRRFSVSIKTQIQTAKGELREGFDLLVHDAERDETKRFEDMSGGERVWVNEALTRGIALYLARESGQAYETLFSDESDGPLDPDKKLQFMRMKREVLKLGGYTREYFVSQSPELWAMADARIDLGAL